MNMKQRTSIIGTAIALLCVVVFVAGCFIPVPGFRDGDNGANNNGSTRNPPPKPWNPPNNPPDNPGGKPMPGERNPDANGSGTYHTVARGDTIYSISKSYGVPQHKIIAANNLSDPDNLAVGQRLLIPDYHGDPIPARPGALPNPNDPNPRHPEPLPPPDTPRKPSSKCPPGAMDFMWPIEGKLTSGFGMRNGRHHDGIDISNKIGTDIYAAADGTVIYSGRLGGYGLIVIIKHEGDFKTIYAHNRENVVKKGDTVTKGQKIAELGASGNATGPHLHFEVRCGQEALDPLLYLPKH